MKRSRIKPMSDRRASEREAREECRRRVIDRDRGCVAERLPSVPCSQQFEMDLDVHELRGGPERRLTYLDETQCLAVCRTTHRWIHDHPHAAQAAGLLLPSWAVGEEYLTEATWLRLEAMSGVPGRPSWWMPDIEPPSL